ncbi:hypothetical protein [Micromonospora peucetia]|uniref:Helix-turn-helix domain n=1 Tax=Micromonospora peucetia TaxID=47871 RepID=A0A1C6TYF9_9ACTN|nr:hypothetical protein [Micromonospora peucetia]WSA33128.1 helix-turn-helix domain-containing protein [Micromonospora peucetia]SCL46814.1 Helix-turn-helix domain [Micromonospora peucetia]
MSATDDETSHLRIPTEIQDFVAAGKLTIHAAWLYGLLLRHINYTRGDAHVWPSRSNLAKRMQFKNTRAVDRYLTELAAAGLIETERRRKGEANDTNRYTLLLVSWPKTPATRGGAPQHTTPSALKNTTLVSHSAPELEELQLDEHELDQRSDQSSLPSGRFAPSGADETQSRFADEWNPPAQRQPSTAKKLTQQRIDDRATFLSLINAGHLRSDGTTFGKGVWTVDAFYNAFRKLKSTKKPIGFPGAYIEGMAERDPDNGVEDWLLTLGLEPA